MKTLHGHVMRDGIGDASNWDIDAIRKATGRGGLRRGTLNLKLDAPHKLRGEYQLSRKDRADGRDEDLAFEPCLLVTNSGTASALIARTSTNHWGDEGLEIMADDHLRSRYGLNDGDSISVVLTMPLTLEVKSDNVEVKADRQAAARRVIACLGTR